MSSGTGTSGRPVLRRRAVAMALIALTAGGGSLVPAPQAALGAVLAASAISAGGNHSCAIESGMAYCWGDNVSGDLGNGKTVGSSVPEAVDASGVLAGKTLTQIAAGDSHTCALDSAGAAYCWGSNIVGELGDGGTADHSSVPVAVVTSGVLAGRHLTQIAVGNNYTCALDSAGAAYCWGLDVDGELGDGGTADHSSVPVAVDAGGALAGKTLTQITAADSHTCALDSAGAAYCWGDNTFGELGDGSTTNSGVPVAVDAGGLPAGQRLAQIAAAGQFHTCAVDRAGAAFCWGLNSSGQLGDGSTDDSAVPVAVDARGVLARKVLTGIAPGGGYHTCAVDAAGAAYCWGYNFYGQLGNGSTVDHSNVPVAVDVSGILARRSLTRVTAGYYHECALDGTGAAFCWGLNSSGQLGDRSTGTSPVPVLVGRDAPARVTAVTGLRAAIVSWQAPVSLAGGTLTGYTATASPGGAACSTTGATTCTITGLADGDSYSVTVVAHTTAGDSGPSAAATVSVTHGPSGPVVSGLHPAKCVADSGDSSVNGAPVVIGDCGGVGQAWTVEGDGTIQIHGRCMDIYRERKTNRALVELYACTGGANQQWLPQHGTLVNPVSGKCLDDPRFNVSDGTQLEIYTCNGGANQQWRIP
jgi:alpha-tubulin suppressor-like RCC1 family protein